MDLQTQVDYKELVNAYWEGLTTTLRGFRPGATFLNMWVPDDDHLKSILNLTEAAQSAGMDTLSIVIDNTTLQSLDFSALSALLAEFGTVATHQQDSGLILEIANMQGLASFQDIHPIYQQALQAAYVNRSDESHLNTGEELTGGELIQVESSVQGVVLSVLVDPSSHVISQASYRGASLPTQQALLQVLCDVLVGMTMQEAHDHAGIYLEYRLRDHTQPAPVAGIITPRASDMAFQLPIALTRLLLKNYQQLVDYVVVWNEFDRPPSSDWVALTIEEKASKLSAVISQIYADLSIQTPIPEITRIDEHIKVTLLFDSEIPPADKQRYLMQLERGLKQRLEEKLQLYMEEMKDLNKIRRLA